MRTSYNKGSVCEFDDGKHTERVLLGVVKGASAKAKGGTIYQLQDAEGKVCVCVCVCDPCACNVSSSM